MATPRKNSAHGVKVAKRETAWRGWLSKTKFFARGAYARVYRKNESNYPHQYYRARGELVKIVEVPKQTAALGFMHVHNPHYNPRAMYWGMKLAYELFPSCFPKVTGMRKRGNHFEIHMKEVPMHEELADYMDMLARKQHSNHKWLAMEGQILSRMNHHTPRVMEILETLSRAGIVPHMENNTNVSLADPEHPVFFEPDILHPHLVEAHIRGLTNASQKKRAQALFARYLDSLPQLR